MASYYVWSGAAGAANGTSWANAYTTLALAFATGKTAGDVFYVAHDHLEATAGSLTLTVAASSAANPIKVICVNRAGSVPPVSADRRTTAQVTVTTTGGLNTYGHIHYDGIIFIAGTTSSSIFAAHGAGGHWVRFDNCSLRVPGTSSPSINLGGDQAGTGTELNNTTMSFASLTTLVVVLGIMRWRNTPSALLGTIPTTLFRNTGNRGAIIECIGVDLSAAGSGKTIVNVSGGGGVVCRFIDCKLDAAVTKTAAQTFIGAAEIDFIRTGATGNYTVHSQRFAGLLTEETVIVRTGGASNGTTSISWKIVTTANCTYSVPFECPPIAIWVDTTGSAVTATVEGIGAALPTDAEVWLEVEYLGDASSPQGSFVNDGKADLLATAANQTSSSETWGGSTAAFKLECTFTAQQAGWIYARVKVGKASSTFYIDPMVTLS